MRPKDIFMAAIVLLMSGIVAAQTLDLPKTFFPHAGPWKLKGSRAFDDKTIYDYMNGAADPYMNFTYKQLYVGQYENRDKRIVVEVYDMGSPAEAYGAFTLDVEGTPIPIGTEAAQTEGALRVWKDRFFIKIFDFAAGPLPAADAKLIGEAVAGRIEAAGEKPAILGLIPPSLKPSMFRYFHMDQTLQDIYYVSTKNVLELSAKTEGAWAEIELDGARPKVAVIRYPDAAARDKAWKGFCEAAFTQTAAGAGPIYTEQIKPDESTGIRKFAGAGGELLLALCFEAKNREQCTRILQTLGGEAGRR